MCISKEEQQAYDFDWFAVDADGYLVHLSSWGGKLPASVADSRENLETLESYFGTLPELSTNEEIEATFTAATPNGDLSSYLEYVRRGLFSFDRIDYNNHDSCAYRLVARPPRPVRAADLPPGIAAVVIQTQLPSAVTGLANLDTAAVA
ncbi:hypothetical protein [Hymenobacter sp.]|uniref:hypothetical protein n=1 Tax=Hymenobacter sp. TaxID=1898978 RepID=UPI00286CBF7D|nr:hypothetical protein [Hymenobacter sp.]